MQALPPIDGYEPSPYGSVFHWHMDDKSYKLEHLAKWTDRELLIKHYHLTARLDGYNHLKADQTTKDNCLVFREALRLRGIDGVMHCREMDWLYNAGWRRVKVFYPPIEQENYKPLTDQISFVKIGF